MKNTLQKNLLELLESHPAGINEYQLMQSLADHPAFESLRDGGHLLLFKKHFLIMNGLYQLQDELNKSGNRSLNISPLNIQIVDRKIPAKAELDDSTSPALRDYYLNWNNFDKTGNEDVEMLLGSFWKRFYRVDGRVAALKVLDLTELVTQQEIKQRYRKLAAENHPDKGGDQERFIEIREAYEVLID